MANYSISANVFCLFAMSSQGKTKRREEGEKKKPSCKKKIKNFQTASQKQQPHRPFLRSRVPVRAWPYVQKKTKKTFKQPHRPFLRSRKRRLDCGIVFKKIEKVQKSRKKEYSKSINQEKNRERIQ